MVSLPDYVSFEDGVRHKIYKKQVLDKAIVKAILIFCGLCLCVFVSERFFFSGHQQSFISFRSDIKKYPELVIDEEESNPLEIISPAGTFVGSFGADGVRWWRGIRYAKPPVRFESPVAADPFSEKYLASFDSPGCIMQNGSYVGKFVPAYPTTISEDCLFLSVSAPPKPFQPTNDGTTGYAVLVFIHGGAFMTGFGANDPIYDTSAFSKNEVIGVTFNYRLGAFGFLASSTVAGNYGFEDQKLALQWVQKNIAAFGGDPNRVTIMGQSAGGTSVAAHLSSPGSNGLYSAAIMMSNPVGMSLYTRERANVIAEVIFSACDCPVTSIECLRTVPYWQIVEAYKYIPYDPIVPFTPIVEAGGLIPMQPYEAIATGQYPDVPLFMGFDRDEGIYFVYERITNPLMYQDYIDLVAMLAGPNLGAQIIEAYPFTADTTDGRELVSRIMTDRNFICPLLHISAEAAAARPDSPLFIYEFDHVFPLAYNGAFDYPFLRGKVFHGSELEALFETFSTYKYQPTQSELKLSTNLNLIWSNFIKTHSPNTGDKTSPSFVRFDGTQHLTLLNDTSVVSTYARASLCKNLWDVKIVYPVDI